MASIAYWGIEIEGGWADVPNDPNGSSVSIKRDGSVRVDGCRYVGEVTSPTIEGKDALSAWAMATYPPKSNSSCGIHIHASVANAGLYSRLMDIRFAAYVRRALRKWGESIEAPLRTCGDMQLFWERMKGGNQYCRRSFRPDEQARGENDSRYSFLNFCWGKHKTFELRVLPTFQNKDMAKGAIKAYCSAVEAWVAKIPDRAHPAQALRRVVDPTSTVTHLVVGDAVEYKAKTWWVHTIRPSSNRAGTEAIISRPCGGDTTHDTVLIGMLKRTDERPPESIVNRFQNDGRGHYIRERWSPVQPEDFVVGSIVAVPSEEVRKLGYDCKSPIALGLYRQANEREGMSVMWLTGGDCCVLNANDVQGARRATKDDLNQFIMEDILVGRARGCGDECVAALRRLIMGAPTEEE